MPTLWFTVAFNLSALFIAVVGIGFDDGTAQTWLTPVVGGS